MDDFQDILERQQQIQDLDKRIELKWLGLQHLQKNESLRPSRSLSTDTKPKTNSKDPKSAANSGTVKIKKEAGVPDSVFSELDDFQDILERQQQIQDLDKRIELKWLGLQHLQKNESLNLTSASMLQYNPVPGPAAFQNATLIILVNDPDQATSAGGKSSLSRCYVPVRQ